MACHFNVGFMVWACLFIRREIDCGYCCEILLFQRVCLFVRAYSLDARGIRDFSIAVPLLLGKKRLANMWLP